MRVSLYIPCYNAERFIDRCLGAACSQTHTPDEIIVVDDGSTDASAQIARRYDVKLVQHTNNKGLSAARNTAIKAASGELVASLDADCVARPDWLATLIDCLEHTRAIGVGGRLVETNTASIADRWRTRHMPQHWGTRRRQPPFLFGNNNLFVKRELIAAGLYPEALRTNYEDVTMSTALLARGATLVYEPAAIVEHLRADTISSVLRANWTWRFFGYDQRISLSNALKACGRQLTRELPRYLWHDLRGADTACGLLSVVAVAYAVDHTLRHAVKHRGQPSVIDGHAR